MLKRPGHFVKHLGSKDKAKFGCSHALGFTVEDNDADYFIDIPWSAIHAAVQWQKDQELAKRPDVGECPVCMEYIRAADIDRHMEAHGNG